VLVGIVLVDLVFDFADDKLAIQTYYRVMMRGLITSIVIPCCMGLLATIVLRRCWTTPGWRSQLLLGMFICGAPYFELVLKPAELALVQLGPKEDSFDSAIDSIRKGHLVLLVLLVVTLVVTYTEPPYALTVVNRFLKAQDDRDLDAMCALVADDVTYINEPHPATRDITTKALFRRAFEGSPCIWAEDAKLKVLRCSCDGNTVYVERLDNFLIEGKWLQIPIFGYIVVHNGKVQYWKDYFCYKKYKEQVTALFGPQFSLFKATKAQ